MGAGVGTGVGASVSGACFPGHVGVLGSGGAHVGERGVHLAVEPELLRHLGVLQGGGAGVAEGAVAGLHGQFGVLGGPEPGAVLGAEHRVDLVQQPGAATELFGGGGPAWVCGGVGVLAVAGGGVLPVLVGACLGVPWSVSWSWGRSCRSVPEVSPCSVLDFWSCVVCR